MHPAWRYHLLHPDYLGLRVQEVQRGFRLCVVLCLVDAEDVVKPMNQVNKIAAMGDCTLVGPPRYKRICYVIPSNRISSQSRPNS